ncbi:MAG: hypothetical protein OEW48_11340 [Phycisphaerae bacterium]|nr:hypothetical protein [Phycisphaerae bacterium]
MAEQRKAQVRVIVVLSFLLMLIFGGVVGAKTVVKVAKHIVKGSGVTKEDLEEQFKGIKNTWDSADVTHVQVGGVDEVNDVNEGKVAGAINIYGTPLKVKPPGNPGICYNRSHIVIGPNAPNDTGAHEAGHWNDATPDDCNTEHGDPCGLYPGDPNYMGYDTNGNGKQDPNDSNNIMFPGTGRTGSDTDPNQKKRYGENAKKWVESQNAIAGERGSDNPDTVGDAEHSIIDITDTSVWGIGNIFEDYQMNFKMLLQEYPYPSTGDPPVMLGFYIESDQSCETGEPPGGLDYYMGYDTMAEKPVFMVYDPFGGWTHWDPSIIEVEMQYMEFDGPFEPIPIGIKLSLPLMAIKSPLSGDLLSFKAKAESMDGFADYAPDFGMTTILTKPLPPPPPTVLGDLDEDLDVDMRDLALLLGNYLAGVE